jgi:predicted transcriptional regulator of viral defense system
MALRLTHRDRREVSRGTPNGGPPRQELTTTILGSYAEMPGLILTVQQAARLFQVHPRTCEVILNDLASVGRLRRTLDGQYRA